MLIDPGINKLLEKVDNRYTLVIEAAKRARQLSDGAEPLVAAKLDKALSVAVDELNQGKIKILTEEN